MDQKLPEVLGDFGKKPVLNWPETEAPSGLVVEVLHEGNGPVIQPGRQIQVDYHGEIWGGRKFDSSFDRGNPAVFGIGVGQVIQGWDRSIPGKTVGSRLLISIPPAMGYGKRGVPQAGIGGTDTLVFVVDILKQF
ncbi:FKBP-type peptidyl-prolyl cis-trans isomerase [Actinotignum urinale]|uniref:FKBP-type peptidyl-prolyl cis-trans isomerase n=1 Tax=Actinotignum urinale TaxID=190146 RepID=UPI002A801D71|nr:FKBP-type peptidyl-prolyl cis-trans isomerase [Actinotignum urinale]MDY5151905.1 FKBP-type peptidyl-prolyl cis-trans isomerase [Actinotignum urinale]